jgi:Zn-finger nucleic acid-binding protein
MNCPKCGFALTQKYYKGMIEVDYCPNCRGMWLDLDELDRLEDVAFDDDAHKGSLVHNQRPTGYPCPHCATPLQEFEYRLYDLKLDYCTEKHGFWLDAGEDERVLEIMRQRGAQFHPKLDADGEWQQTLKRLRTLFKGL